MNQIKKHPSTLFKGQGKQGASSHPVTFNAIVSRYKEPTGQDQGSEKVLSRLPAPKTTILGAARVTCGLLYDLHCMDPEVITKFETSLSRDLSNAMQAIYTLRGIIRTEREALRYRREGK